MHQNNINNDKAISYTEKSKLDRHIYLVTFEPVRDLTQITPQTTTAILHIANTPSHTLHSIKQQ